MAKPFWDNILRAADTIPHESDTIRGSSGLEHPIVSLGVDEAANRLVVITKEMNGRAAALVQADIQAAATPRQVIVVRPVLYSFAAALQEFPDDSSGVSEVLESFHNMISRSAKVTPKDFLDKWKYSFDAGDAKELLGAILGIQSLKDIRGELGTDPTHDDRELGICAVPLYDFTADELDAISESTDIDSIKSILTKQDLLQFFFPPPDHVALGVVQRGEVSDLSKIQDNVALAPRLGHPFGKSEIASPEASILEIIDHLQSRQLIVEGEFGFELSEEGKAIRQTVRFKPREGLLSKLINRFSLSLNFKDLFGGGS